MSQMQSSYLPLSDCCSAPLKKFSTSSAMSIWKCDQCKSLWAKHHTTESDQSYWSVEDLSPEFMIALKNRREEQAKIIVKHFHQWMNGKIIDYGCGQGVFATQLDGMGLDAFGADIDISAFFAPFPSQKLIEIAEPWGIPFSHYHLFCMLDVLEHHPSPSTFLTKIDSEYLLIKIPKSTGPLTSTAKLLSKLKSPTSLEAIFLVGDVNPHQVLYSKKGLVDTCRKSGWNLIQTLKICDVGSELPDRLRKFEKLGRVKRSLLGMVGKFLEFLSPFWSESEVFLFQKAKISS